MSITEDSLHAVSAFNSAKTSDNKIHDDAVARQYGFAGGLVPGVDVYAYMTHAPVAHWGRDWLAGGSRKTSWDFSIWLLFSGLIILT